MNVIFIFSVSATDGAEIRFEQTDDPLDQSQFDAGQDDDDDVIGDAEEEVKGDEEKGKGEPSKKRNRPWDPKQQKNSKKTRKGKLNLDSIL